MKAIISATKVILPLLCCLLLTSCLSPVKMKPDNKFMLACVPDYVPVKKKRRITVMVMQSDTAPVYNTTAMAFSTCPYQISFYGKNRWAETPAQMLQPLMVETLQKTRHFHAVVTPPYLGKYDYILMTTILKLQQEYACRPGILKLRVRAQIINAYTNRVIATKDFCVREPIPVANPYCGVLAANRATKRFLTQLAAFSLRIR